MVSPSQYPPRYKVNAGALSGSLLVHFVHSLFASLTLRIQYHNVIQPYALASLAGTLTVRWCYAHSSDVLLWYLVGASREELYQNDTGVLQESV